MMNFSRFTKAVTRILVVGILTSIGAAGAQQSDLPYYDVELVIFRNLAADATPELWEKELDSLQYQPPTGNEGTDEAADEESESGAAREAAPVAAAATERFPALSADRFKLSAIAAALKRQRNYQTLAHFGWTQPGYPRSAAHYTAVDVGVPGLTGRAAVSRGKYLHLTLDLSYSPPGSSERYILRQTRRMRSNERHYIDHPKFGVIAVITQSR